MLNKLEITHEGAVLLNGTAIEKCRGVDIKNIDPIGGMEVALHVHVDEVKVDYKVKE